MAAHDGRNEAPDRIETDICVIGAGPAGITFAREWVGSRTRVTLLESGGYTPEAAARDLGRGTTVSTYLDRDGIENGRDRQFGGTANRWLYNTVPNDGRAYARSLPPEPMDFERRPGVGHDGWPVSLADLAPWFARAQAVWNSAPFDYRLERWGADREPPLEFPPGTVRTGIVQHGPRDVFTTRYRDDLLASGNVTILIGHTVVALEADATGDTIGRARVVRSDGRLVEVVARTFVLACGGIENAQLLLLSEPTSPGGPGNRHDVVGRYVMDHPEFRLGTIEPAGRDVFDRLGLYDIRWEGRHLVAGMLTLEEELKRRDALLNTCVALVPQRAGFGSPANRSLATTLSAIARREWPAGTVSRLWTLAASATDTARVVGMRRRPYHEFAGGWSQPGPHRDRFRVIEAHAASEQAPDPENRVMLGLGHDALGRRRPHLRWEWSGRDRANVARSAAHYRDAFEAAGLGRFRPWVEFEGAGRPQFAGIHHPMGGTRMHPDPREGVVDTDGAVHGLANLYITGSSVFTTGNGYANPTLLLLALTIRLADHLKGALAAPVNAEARATEAITSSPD